MKFRGSIKFSPCGGYQPRMESPDGTIVIDILPSDHGTQWRALIHYFGFKTFDGAKRSAESKAKTLGVEIDWRGTEFYTTAT